MSKSLLKKSLEMFKDDIVPKDTSKKKSTNAKDKISTKRKGVRKELRRLKQQEEMTKQLKLNSKRQRTAADDYADMQECDMTEQTIAQIQRISALSKATKYATETVLEHHRGKLSKDRLPDEVQAPEPKSVLFDD